MPIINGQKMACEPCIRGHRSTRCNHAPDRIMVPVRKPGRPLSTCPHPPGRTCQCGPRVTAALPKGAACRCGVSPNKAKANGTAAIVKAEPADSAPLSPSKNPSFRIQKPAPRHSQKPSFDASILQRMTVDDFQLNGSANDIPAAHENSMGQMGSLGSTNYPYVAPLQNGSHNYPYSAHAALPAVDNTMEAVDFSLVGLDGGAPNIPPTSSSMNGISGPSEDSSGTLTPGTSGSPYHTPTSSNGDPSPQEPFLEGVGSCCSAPQPQFQSHLQAGTPQGGAMMGYSPQFSQPGAINFQQSSMYPNAPIFGTPNSPLQPAQWQQIMESYHLGQVGTNGPNGAPALSFTNHVCVCGPSCECLGCTAHPYNQATSKYIQDTMQCQYESDSVDAGNLMPDPPLATGNASPPTIQSPSETDSPDLNLSPSDFLFVDYSMGICGCGDDCACVNCLIHRDPQDKTPT
ncbi:hypothetical protein GGR54DRAFT_351797 [Hypoxylon sp. NC1633]|nr:hypothetical protein GGR54DRAFT_351797 [Hypoxylon sp. NC1633]